MTVYTTVPQDDSNLEITLTEADDIVTLDLASVSLTLIGAVNSVNGQTGDVVLPLGLTEGETQTLINNSIAAIDYPVDTVNGQTGDVTLTTNDISENVKLYYTDSRVDDYLNSGSITSIATGSLQLTGGVGNQGLMSWNTDEETVDIVLNGSVLQVGQETHIHVRNGTGSTILNGTAVYVSGTVGNSGRLLVAPMIANNTIEARLFIGVATEDIEPNGDGKVTDFGKVRGVDTTAFAEGDVVWVSTTTPGALTNITPISPNLKIPTGFIITSGTNGTIFVRAEHGIDLHNNHRVEVSNLQQDDLLAWNAGLTRWENHTIGALGLATTAYVDAAIPTLTSELSNDSGFITSYTETDPIFSASIAAGITTQNIVDWTTAYNWGDHALAGYSTFSGDYNDLTNQPTIPADVGDLTDVGGLLLTAEDLYKDADSVLQVNNGAQGKWTFRTTYDAPWDIYNSDLNFQSFGDSTGGLFNTVRYKTTGNNTFLQFNIEDTGTGDDGSHRTIMELRGSETILGVNSGRLQINAPEIYSDNLTLASGGAFNFIGGPTVINSVNSTLPDDYSILEVNANNHIDLIAWDAVGAAQSNMLRVIKRNIEGGVGVDDTQWMAMQWGSSDGANFYQIGQLGSRYDTVDGHETKIQTFDPNTNTLINNWTVHEHYIYGGKPIRQTYYNNIDRDALTVVQDGMLIWNTDANALQVYHTGAWNAVGGGGGASALNDLTDVNIGVVPLADGDLLRYNGTAMEWQNTNLGISVTPTIELGPNFYKGTGAVCTITNYGAYDDPNIWAQVKDSLGTVVVTNAQITDNYNGTFSFSVPNTLGTYTLEVRVQDFGDLASEIATDTFDVIEINGTFRYWRFTSDPNSTGGVQQFQGVNEVRLYTGNGQTGTKWPTASMTDNNVPAPFVASSRYNNAGASYNPHEAFDNNTGSGWIDSFTATLPGQYLQIDLGSSVNIKSFSFRAGILTSFTPPSFFIYGSDTGAFAGEETLVATMTGMPNTGEGTLG